MFNFYVILASHDMITDNGKATTWRQKWKTHDYEQTYKNEGPSEDMGLNRNKVWRFQTKKTTKTKFSIFQKHPLVHTAPNCNFWIGIW